MLGAGGTSAGLPDNSQTVHNKEMNQHSNGRVGWTHFLVDMKCVLKRVLILESMILHVVVRWDGE